MPITRKSQNINIVVRWRDDAVGYGDDIVFDHGQAAGHANVRAFINSRRGWIEQEKARRIAAWQNGHGQGGGGNPHSGGNNG